jgi:TRAP-type C4-dicarboxylate transport system permease large subunit
MDHTHAAPVLAALVVQTSVERLYCAGAARNQLMAVAVKVLSNYRLRKVDAEQASQGGGRYHA